MITTSRSRQLLTIVVGVATLATATPASASHIGRDGATRFSSCAPPSGSIRLCKPLLNTPPFPEATHIKGPSGSTIVAYAEDGSRPGSAWDLMFANSQDRAGGGLCPLVAEVGGAGGDGRQRSYSCHDRDDSARVASGIWRRVLPRRHPPAD